MKSLASSIHCKVRKLHVMYLVLPIGARARSTTLWNSIMENLKRNHICGRGGTFH